MQQAPPVTRYLHGERVAGREGGDGAMHRVAGPAASREAEIHIAQAEAPVAAFERCGRRRWIERRPAQDGGTGWQRVPPAVCALEAGEGERPARAGHGHVTQPPQRVAVLSIAGTVPTAIQDDHVIELQAFGLSAVTSN